VAAGFFRVQEKWTHAELSQEKNFGTKKQADNEFTGRIFIYGTKSVP
jgi:hypothetical protein